MDWLIENEEREREKGKIIKLINGELKLPVLRSESAEFASKKF